jgi:hypothetical protein
LSTTPATVLELASAACTVGSIKTAATNAIKLLNPRHDLVLISAFSCLPIRVSRALRPAVDLGIEAAPR